MKSGFPHYWMCSACAYCMGGVWPYEGYVCTVTKGTCEYCGFENEILTPWVDYNWPDLESLDRVAKVVRD
jgi:hypothetical protein